MTLYSRGMSSRGYVVIFRYFWMLDGLPFVQPIGGPRSVYKSQPQQSRNPSCIKVYIISDIRDFIAMLFFYNVNASQKRVLSSRDRSWSRLSSSFLKVFILVLRLFRLKLLVLFWVLSLRSWQQNCQQFYSVTKIL